MVNNSFLATFISLVLVCSSVGSLVAAPVSVTGILSSTEARKLTEKASSANTFVINAVPQTFQGPIVIDVQESYRIPMSLVPAWHGNRGFMKMPLVAVTREIEPLAHELTHIHYPNANRMLAEGYAVYIQEKFGGQVYPNFGKNIEELLKDKISGLDIGTLDAISTPTPISISGDDKLAYLAAGSFVRFLILKYGADKFHALYQRTPFAAGVSQPQDPNRYASLFGKTLGELNSEWKAWVASVTKNASGK